MNIRYFYLLAFAFATSTDIGLASSINHNVQVDVYVPKPPGIVKFVSPEYPAKLAVTGVSGNGVFSVKVNSKTGEVEEVKVIKSCGYSLLNELAAKALLQWKFQPGSAAQLKVPVEFRAYGFSRNVH
jgi:TonB family protein